jgi:hypothetical protein
MSSVYSSQSTSWSGDSTDPLLVDTDRVVKEPRPRPNGSVRNHAAFILTARAVPTAVPAGRAPRLPLRRPSQPAPTPVLRDRRAAGRIGKTGRLRCPPTSV